MTDRELLRAAIDHTGLPDGQYAVRVLGVSDQSVSDWLTGRTRMQEPTRRLLRLLAAHPTLWRELDPLTTPPRA